MKRFKLIVFFLTLLAISLSCAKSKINESDIVASSETLVRFIKPRLKAEYLNLPEVKIIAVPSVNINSSLFTRDIKAISLSLQLDSAVGYVIIKDKSNKVVDIVRKHSSKVITTSEAITESDLQTTRMIDFVINRYSKNPFFVNLTEEDSNQIIAFFVKDEIHFLNQNMKISTNFESLITQEIGSVEKYIERKAIDRTKETLLKGISDRENIFAVLRRDYLTHMNAFPNDTLLIMNKLIDEIQLSSNTTISQNELLRSLLASVKLGRLPYYCGSGVSFYSYDIESYIKLILTQDQFANFLSKRELNSWLTAKASNKLYHMILQEGQIPQEKIPQAMIDEIFKQ